MALRRTIQLVVATAAGPLATYLCKYQAYFVAQHKSCRVSFLAVRIFLLLSGHLGTGAITALFLGDLVSYAFSFFFIIKAGK